MATIKDVQPIRNKEDLDNMKWHLKDIVVSGITYYFCLASTAVYEWVTCSN
ncbi:hypothetical protein BSB_18540 [Bacillus stercoris]|nr:hypothetical protein BSB_18540 [Bacillus stercoris]